MMNLRRVTTLAALSCALLAPAAARADALSQTDLHVSSLGYGIALSHAIAPRADLRVSTGTLGFNRSGTADNLDYTGSVRLRNVAALIDFQPTGSAFRLTTGLLFGSDHIDVTGTGSGNGTYTINGNTYAANQVGTVTGSAKLGSSAPYVGFGIGAPRRRGTYLTADAGVVFRSVSTTLDASGPAAQNPQFQADLAQARHDFANSANVLKTYPVISLGLATRL
jgi:hypothetical protein